MSHLTMLYGASASGKGSRIMNLINHLKKEGIQHETVRRDVYSKKKGKVSDKEVGILFKDINLFIFGKPNSFRKESWESVDQYDRFTARE